MFGFFKKSRKGKIEKKFGWLTIKNIALELENSDHTPRDIATCLLRLAIFGGLNVKRSLEDKKVLTSADPDRVVVEVSAFTWTCIFSQCLDSRKLDIYVDEKLADSIYMCSDVLRELLSSTAEFEVEKSYLAPYLNSDLIKATEKLEGRLLKIGGIGMLEGIEDHVGVSIEAKAYSSTIVPAILDSTVDIINFYIGNSEFD